MDGAYPLGKACSGEVVVLTSFFSRLILLGTIHHRQKIRDALDSLPDSKKPKKKKSFLVTVRNILLKMINAG